MSRKGIQTSCSNRNYNISLMFVLHNIDHLVDHFPCFIDICMSHASKGLIFTHISALLSSWHCGHGLHNQIVILFIHVKFIFIVFNSTCQFVSSIHPPTDCLEWSEQHLSTAPHSLFQLLVGGSAQPSPPPHPLLIHTHTCSKDVV